MNADPELVHYAKTDRQIKVIQTVVEKGGNISATARELGIQRHHVKDVLRIVRKYAALQGYAPEHGIKHTLPDHLMLKGTSVLVDERSGETVLQWYKSTADLKKLNEVITEAVQAMAAEIPPEKAVLPPKHSLDDLMSVYVLTDYHIGVNIWGREAGADWNLQAAEDALYNWIDTAIGMVPPSRTAVFAQLGDFLHWDGLVAVTPAHHHVLDADTRFQKMIGVAVRAIRRVIRSMLSHHEEVIILMAEGNHDPASSAWLRVMMEALYEEEPRVRVITDPLPYYHVEHGSTSIFFHHGHLRKPKNVAESLAAQFREVFGRTKYSYAHLGHQHHVDVKESPLMVVEQHQTLAPRDSYSARQGHHAQRSAQIITYHKDQGEVGRVRIPSIALESDAA